MTTRVPHPSVPRPPIPRLRAALLRTATILAAVVLAAVTLAACGGDDGAGTEADQPADPAEEVRAPDIPVLGDPLVLLEQPVDLAVRPGDDALYLVERTGRVRIVRDELLQDRPALDITGETVAQGEQGFLGLAFSLDGGTAYLNYTDRDGTTVVESVPVAADGTFDAGGRAVVITIDQPFTNHNGGGLLVGPDDGLLYVPTGDGGSAGDPERVALDVSSLLGKLLRIAPLPGGGYEVPGDNPFVGVDGARPEIWAVGLRNPWRSSFDRETGDLWLADVGQNAIEEVSVAWSDQGLGRGVSFGWSAFEGTQRFNDDEPGDGHVPPIFDYPHGEAGCSISGGVRYRGDAISGLQGAYVFGDFCSGLVWALPVDDDRRVGELVEIGQISSVAAVSQGPDGELYVLSLDGAVIPLVAA